MPRQTPLFEEHLKLNARMVEFAGWSMPIQYKGLLEEHHCVRNQVGLFDVSHMGEIRFKGSRALESLEWLTTNRVSSLKAGQAQYSLLANESGGLVDDVIVYCLEENKDYLMCVNAANKDKDLAWVQTHNKACDLSDESSRWAQIAVQGPSALALISETLSLDVLQMRPFHLRRGSFAGGDFIFATTGYTGELGGEIFISEGQAPELWRKLLHEGSKFGVQAIGLGARDTLRTEMAYSLYGHEIDEHTNPYAAGLGWVVKAKEKDFLGRSALLAGKEKGLKEKLVGLKMVDKGIPRQGYTLVLEDGSKIGQITSGTHSPTLEEPIGIAYILADLAHEGQRVFVDIRGRKASAQVCKLPFLSKKN